ncbi:polar amino acid transport system substrate-binding protein [Oxalobacteraceae bacterium GrIS 2.11]
MLKLIFAENLCLHFIRSTLLLSCLCTAFNAHSEQQLLITTESSIPFNMSNDGGKTVFGLTADEVHEIMRRAQIPYQMQIMSWNRAFELARTQSNTCVFETARTQDRETRFKWIGPISKGEWGIYGSPDKLGKIKQLADIKNASIGGYKGDALGEYLTKHGYHVVNSYDDETTLRNLLIGRLEYWTSDTTQAQPMLIKSHATDKVTLLFTYGTSEYYLACNPKVRDAWVDLMRAKLKEIKADGTEAKIEAKY